jgi:RNA polymerase sigma-70 factor (ECF subfamily)
VDARNRMPSRSRSDADSGAAALIARAREGDVGALAALFREHAHAVQRVAYHLTASHDDADDVLQDVFVGLPEALRGLSDAETFPAWLRRVAARAALMRMRSERRRRQSPIDAAGGSQSPSPGGLDRLALADAVGSLPRDLRAVFVLKEIEGYSHDEIASLLGITRGNSEVRLFRARRRLRAQLGG